MGLEVRNLVRTCHHPSTPPHHETYAYYGSYDGCFGRTPEGDYNKRIDDALLASFVNFSNPGEFPLFNGILRKYTVFRLILLARTSIFRDRQSR